MNLFSIEAEQSVIGAMILDQSVINDICENLVAEDFFHAENRILFSCIVDMLNKRIPVEPITLDEQVQNIGGESLLVYILEIATNTPSSANSSAYAKIVKEYSRKRSLQGALDVCAEMIHKDRGATSDELIARSAAVIGGLHCDDGQGLRNTKQILKSLAQKWDKRCQAGDHYDGLLTGIKALDDRYRGWKPGDLIVVAGRPSMGKSVMAFQVSLHNSINLGKRTMVFSLEMTAEQLIERGTAAVGHVHLDVFRKCDTKEFGKFQHEIMTAAGRIANSDILIDETPSLHINQIMARARNAHRKAPLSLVVVDHINIARGDGQSREREIAQITGGLKSLAKELGCPVVAVTQLNRKVEERANKRPIMSDLRDSGSIEQDADIVMLLYRDEYYNEDSAEKGIIEIITGKFREGETGIDRCASMLHQSRIADLSPDYMPPPQEQKKPYRKEFN